MNKSEKKKIIKDDWSIYSYPNGEKKFIESVKKAAKLGIFKEHAHSINTAN